eukprot:10988302-Alexandrium_andersonii.AAC.1
MCIRDRYPSRRLGLHRCRSCGVGHRNSRWLNRSLGLSCPHVLTCILKLDLTLALALPLAFAL